MANRRKAANLWRGAPFLIGLLAMALTACQSENAVRDFCVAEDRRIPDREKIIRLLMNRAGSQQSERQFWQWAGRTSKHFGQWMSREAPDPHDSKEDRHAIGRYLDDHPNFAQIVGRETDSSLIVMSRSDVDSYKKAVKSGYYADIIIMGGSSYNYPRFHEGKGFLRSYWKEYRWRRYNITNCARFTNWNSNVG